MDVGESSGQRRVMSVPNGQNLDFSNNPQFNLNSMPPFHLINPNLLPTLSPQQAMFGRIEQERSLSLLQLLDDEGLIPSKEEDDKRKRIVNSLKMIVLKWIKRVANKHQLPKRFASIVSATVSTYGSYGLGVHASESDIDALCVGPRFANMADDFFVDLHDMLASLKEVSDIHCIKDAKVPLMRFKFDGISVDLPYAQLQVMSVPQNADILNVVFLRNISKGSWKALSGVRANSSILQLVPNVEFFQAMLRCLKLWARRRGVYGHLFGFLGGVHLAVLAAFICLRLPNIGLSAAVAAFFQIFDKWQWPTPVTLSSVILPSTVRISTFMPIQLPSGPGEFCHSNITRSTFRKIREELFRGHKLTQDMLKQDFDWKTLFQPYPYTSTYEWFIQLRILASNQKELGNWMGWVKSRFRLLLLKFEDVQILCDPNPTDYFDIGLQKPNIVFYWGVLPNKLDHVDINSIGENFRRTLNEGYQGPHGELALAMVEASQVPRAQESNDTKAFWRQRHLKHIPDHSAGAAASKGSSTHPSVWV